MNNKQSIRSVDISADEWLQMIRSEEGCIVRVKPHGNSMWPLIRSDRDAVEIAPVDRELKIGDIVVFRRGDGQAVIHRICVISGDEVQTRGDNCSNPDAPVKKTDIIGMAVRIHRGAISFDPDKAAGVAKVFRFSTSEMRKIKSMIKKRVNL